MEKSKRIMSPMIEQYLNIKKNYQNMLLFYRMGDFYELFFEDAEEAAKLLDITLTSRGKLDDEPIKMAGVPYHSVEQYLSKLVKLGKSMAICEQMEEPKPGKGPVAREVVKIITPGTLTDNALLAGKTTNRIIAVSNYKTHYGIAWASLEKGEFKVKKIDPDDLENELHRLQVAEILIDDTQKITVPPSWKDKITLINEWHFLAQSAYDLLITFFQTQNLLSFGLDLKEDTAVISAAGALLNYIKVTQKILPKHFDKLILENDTNYLILDSSTRKHLEISVTISGKNAPTLFSTMDHCASNMGSRLLLSWLHNPLRNHEQIIARQNAVIELIDHHEEIQKTLAKISDVERIMARISFGNVRPRDLSALRDSLYHILNLKHFNFKTELLKKIFSIMPKCVEIADFLKKSIQPEPSIWLKDGNVIKEGFNEELDNIRKIQFHSDQFLLNLEREEKEKYQFNTLKIEYNKVFGFYIELSLKEAKNAPDDYIRTQTLKNVERFTTVSLKEFEQNFFASQQKSLQLEKKLFEEIIQNLQQKVLLLKSISHCIASLDVLATYSKLAIFNHLVQPKFVNYPIIDILGGKHPVIANIIDNFIENDLSLDNHKKFMILTGPNMGGKSTYMRQTALIVLLAHTGAFVPAQKVILGDVDRIFTRIGASDDLASNQSTFMMEMTETAYILNNASEKSLVLIDEVGRGTSTLDGKLLAHEIALYLIKKNRSFTLFATHYFELTQICLSHSPAFNMHFDAYNDKDNIVFLHEVKAGPALKSYGIAVAKLAGLPKALVQTAQNKLISIEEEEYKNQNQLDLFHQNVKPGKTQVDDVANLQFNEIKEELNQLNLNDMTPKEALDLLYQLKEKYFKQ